MFSHMTVGSDDLERSKTFYDAVLGALGVAPGRHDPKKDRLVYAASGGRFLVTRPIDGQRATAGNGSTVGFACISPEQADAWHSAGVANGGVSIEGPPGVRDNGVRRLYLAYLRDPDGNKLCALHDMH